MAEQESDKTRAVHGIVRSPCRRCGETIPRDTLACPACGEKRLFNQEQYDMLMRCRELQDMTEWREWRNSNPDEPIHLEGAQLLSANLANALMRGAYLGGANLHSARLEAADLWGVHLEDAFLSAAHLEGAMLTSAHLERAGLFEAHLEGAHLMDAHLEEANLSKAHLEDANLVQAHLERARLFNAHLEGAALVAAHLEGATARMAVVSTETILSGCIHDRGTDFTGVGLGAARVEPALKSLLERNIRQIGWEKWYERSWARKWLFSLPVRAFWWVSDYGSSTARIMLVFLLLSVVFACVYYRCEIVRTPGFVTNLSEVAGQPVPQLLLPLRALYFSVVTMTTLGFGDIHAHPQSYAGHALLMAQVVLGYVLLGALITRFAIMFQGTTVPYSGRLNV